MKKIIIILLAVLVLIAGGAGGYYLGYQKGTEQTEQHDLGYEAGSGAGYQAESEADYQSGYNDGLSKGYKDGEEEGYLAGYRDCQAGKEKPKPEPYLLNVAGPLDASNFIQSGLIQGWAIRFFNLVITDISVSDYILVLASTKSDRIGWERLKVVAGPVTKITKAVAVPVVGEPGRVTFEEREIKFTDLQVGDVVEVYALWQEHDNMQPRASITVWDKRQLEELEESEKLELSISWIAMINGDVEKIDGRTLTLVRKSERLNVFIREDALIYLLIYQGPRNEVSFSEIKLGDSIALDANFTKEKKLEGTEITI